MVLPRGLGWRRLLLGRIGGVAAAVVELVRPERAVGARGEEGEPARSVEREPRGHRRDRMRGGFYAQRRALQDLRRELEVLGRRGGHGRRRHAQHGAVFARDEQPRRARCAGVVGEPAERRGRRGQRRRAEQRHALAPTAAVEDQPAVGRGGHQVLARRVEGELRDARVREARTQHEREPAALGRRLGRLRLGSPRVDAQHAVRRGGGDEAQRAARRDGGRLAAQLGGGEHGARGAVEAAERAVLAHRDHLTHGAIGRGAAQLAREQRSGDHLAHVVRGGTRGRENRTHLVRPGEEVGGGE
eukprot:scaffold85781_cov61-Phaeocystis_antarctica.AAC.5